MVKAEKVGGALIQDLGFAGKMGQKDRGAKGLMMLWKHKVVTTARLHTEKWAEIVLRVCGGEGVEDGSGNWMFLCKED